MSFGRFAGIVGATVAATMLVALPALRSSEGGPTATLLGALLAAANVLLAYALVLWARERSQTAFLRAILGGMAVRMALLLLLVLVAIRVFGVAQMPFVLSLLGHSMVFLALELRVLHRAPLQAPR